MSKGLLCFSYTLVCCFCCSRGLWQCSRSLLPSPSLAAIPHARQPSPHACSTGVFRALSSCYDRHQLEAQHA